MKRLKLFFACLLMAVLSIGQVWGIDYELVYTLDCASASTDGTQQAYGVNSTTVMTGAGVKAFLNAAAGSNLVSTDATVTGSVYWAKGQGGGDIPAEVLKIGKASGPGSISFTIGGDDDITKVVIVGYGWKNTSSISVNSATAQVYSTAQVEHEYVFDNLTATKNISIVVTTSAICVTEIQLYKTKAGGNPSCATPTFSPAAGLYVGSQNVTISCETTGATIYYTTDDSEPTTSSSVYTNAIPVSGTTTIKALAVKTNYENSNASAKYTIVEHAGTEADPYTVADARAAIDANAGVTNVYATGIVSEIVTAYSSQHGNISYNISSDGLTTSDQLQAYRGKSYNGDNFTSEDDIQVGDVVVVYGNLVKYGSSAPYTYEFAANNQLVSLDRPTSDAGVITATPASVEVAAAGEANGSIAVSYTGISDMDLVEAVALYADVDHTVPFTGGWLTAAWNGDKSAVEYTVNANTGAARTAYIYLYALDDNGDGVEKVIEVSQAKYSVDYAELPFAFNGGRADIEDKDGMTQEDLDTDYTGDANVNTKLKFKTTGTNVIIHINADPGTLTYDIKGNSFSGGTFDVLQSPNGTDYTSVASYTELGAVQSESKTLEQTTRYVKFIYTEKVGGNVALGNITISEYVAPTVCEAPAFTPESGETFTETLDVVLASATDGATIYYTLDGSEPTTASSVFGEKITLTETTTINAIAVKDGLSNSSVASATFTKVLIIDSYDIDFETNDLAPYVNWEFSNIACATSTIDAHGGDYYGNTDGKTSALITTKAKYANPGTLTFWTSKESGNTTASSWVVAVSADGTDWSTEVATFSATTGNKGDWTKREADLSDYTDVYVRIAYDGTAAVRAIDDISLEPAAPVKKPVISDEESFLTSAEVSITCGTAGATIYYTTDGSDPKSGSEYSSSFTLTETATVRAIAKLDEDWSAEAESKTFTKIDIVNVETALNASENDNVYVQGTITSITEVNTGYKNATYVISDMSAGLPQNEMIVYRGKYVNGADFTSADQIHIGDVVVVSGTIGIHDAKNQLAQGNKIETISAPAVAAPTFTPDGGGFMGETDVTITCATDNSTIYYTINGSTNPTKSSDEYTGAIHLTATTTIKAIAYVGNESSLVVEKTFTYTAPMTVADAFDALDSEDPINNAAVAGIVFKVDACAGNTYATYWISDDGTNAEKKLEIYHGYGLNGANFAANGIQEGDEVTVFGNLTIYKNNQDVEICREFEAGSRLLAFNRPVVAVTGVEVDETATVKVNKTVQLTANVLPANATNQNVTWSVTSGATYAEVNETTGVVTGLAEGEAVIRATSVADNTKFDECTVTVTQGTPANTDILTAEEIGVEGNSYSPWQDKTGFGTASVYAGNSTNGTGTNDGAIQLKSKDSNSGIILTTSNGLYLKNLSVTVKSGSNTLNVYAKNTAYTSTEELYSNDEATRGKLIGTVSATGEMTPEEGISYNDNYQYIGMRSASGALYLDDITITWGEAYVAPEPPVVNYTEVRNELTEGWYYTMCLDKAVTAVKAGSIWKVLSKAANGNDVILEEAELPLAAGRPYIFRAAASTLEVAYTGDAVGAPVNDEDNNGLVGSFTGGLIAQSPNNYIIWDNALYYVNSGNVSVGAHRAYLDMTGVPAYNNEPQQGNAPRRRVVMTVHGEQTATGMENVQGDNVQCTKVLIDGQMYILRGEKLYDATGKLVK